MVKLFIVLINNISGCGRLRRLSETGIMDRQRKIFHATQPKCVRKIHAADLTVGMNAIYSALFMLFGGVMLSLVVLIIEIVVSAKK